MFDLGQEAQPAETRWSWKLNVEKKNHDCQASSAGLLHKIRVTLDEAENFPIIGQQI
jgi:hypothetical protein